MTGPLPLREVRVLELAAPWVSFAGRLLRGLGADVVLLHPPGRPVEAAHGDGLESVHLHAHKRARPRSSRAGWTARTCCWRRRLSPSVPRSAWRRPPSA